MNTEKTREPHLKDAWDQLKDAAREDGHFIDSGSSCRLCACLGEMEKAVNAVFEQ